MARPGPAPSRRGGTAAQRAPALDGRVQRGERSRARILEAVFELIGEGTPRPTARQVADRAGVGTRTVFRHFEDMEALYAEIDARTLELARPLLEPGEPARGALSERARAFVARRAALYERVAPFMRSAAVQRWRSSFLSKRHAEMVRHLRRDLLAALPELEATGHLEAAEALSSFETWDRLRRDQRLGRERAEEKLTAALLAWLG